MFCEKCLLDVSNGERRWHCPDCRKQHNCTVNSLTRNYHLEKLVDKFKKESHEIYLEPVKSMIVLLNIVSKLFFWYIKYTVYKVYSMLCQCSFMKHSKMSKRVQEHTAKMEGKAIVNESRTLLRK